MQGWEPIPMSGCELEPMEGITIETPTAAARAHRESQERGAAAIMQLNPKIRHQGVDQDTRC